MSRPIAVEEEGSDEAFDAFITYLNTPSKSNTKAKDNHASYNNIMFPSVVTDTVDGGSQYPSLILLRLWTLLLLLINCDCDIA